MSDSIGSKMAKRSFWSASGENERNEPRDGFPIGNSIAEQLKKDRHLSVSMRLSLQRNVSHHSWLCMLQN